MIIELLNGTRLDIENYGLKRLFHHIPSAEINHTTTTVEGRGDIVTSSTLGNRVIEVEFGFRVADIHDYYLLRDEMNALFVRQEPFYITFKREPSKRWKVRLNEQFMVEPSKRLGSFVIAFYTENIFADSTFTTYELQHSKLWDIDKFSWNGSIDWDSGYFYEFTDNNMTVFNVGNVNVDPRYNDLKITLTGNFPNGLTITNNTTNEQYIYYGNLTNSDTLVIDKIRTFKNGVSVFSETNKKFITLTKGRNDITVSGGSVSNINFDFRFLYL